MENKIEFKVCNQGGNAKAYKECEQFIEKWQKRLRIQDWEVDLQFLTKHDTEEVVDAAGDHSAFCDKHYLDKSVVLGVNIESPGINDRIESDIIHELLHIMFADQTWILEELQVKGYLKNTLHMCTEQIINLLVRAFLDE